MQAIIEAQYLPAGVPRFRRAGNEYGPVNENRRQKTLSRLNARTFLRAILPVLRPCVH